MKNIVQSSKSTSCQYQCIYKIWSKSTKQFTRYCAQAQFWRQSRAITLFKNQPKITCIRYNMNRVYINAYTKLYQNSSICSEDIEAKHIIHQSRALTLLFINEFSPFESQTIPFRYQCPCKVWEDNRSKATQVRVRKWSADGRADRHSNGSEGET